MAQGFGHVVHRERGHGYGGERFHFHAGFMAHGHFGTDVQAVCGIVVFQLQLAAFQHHRMAQRYQAGGIFGRHDAGQPRHFGNRAFGGLSVGRLDLGIHFRREHHPSGSHGHTAGDGFVAHVHHAAAAVLI